jgi:protein-tyrosine phosphatase
VTTPAEPTDRRIPLNGTFNVRDVGGYPTADGGTIRHRTFLRGDALHQLDDEARAELVEIGLRTVLDLREEFEAQRSPDAVDTTTANVVRLPVFNFTGDSFGPSPEDLEAVYDVMVDKCGGALATAIATLAEPGALPALVHCSAGKDRTGVVTALALSLAGVADEVIAQDYALTSKYLAVEFAHAVQQLQASTGLGQQLNGGALACPPELILRTMERIRTSHGSVAEYLVSNGLEYAQIEALREALVESGTDGI